MGPRAMDLRAKGDPCRLLGPGSTGTLVFYYLKLKVSRVRVKLRHLD